MNIDPKNTISVVQPPILKLAFLLSIIPISWTMALFIDELRVVEFPDWLWILIHLSAVYFLCYFSYRFIRRPEINRHGWKLMLVTALFTLTGIAIFATLTSVKYFPAIASNHPNSYFDKDAGWFSASLWIFLFTVGPFIMILSPLVGWLLSKVVNFKIVRVENNRGINKS